MERRKFLQAVGQLSAAGFFTSSLPVMAGPFSRGEFPNNYFPGDKKLNAEWVKSLYERGKPTTYKKSKNELRYIGMPVGGICCGSVYLGGDGRLWLWDIFNQNQFGVITKVLPVKLPGFNLNEINNMAGALYLEPLTNVSPLQQGFALSIKQNGTAIVKRLHQDDWDEVTFEATYPVARITYTAKNLPLQVSVEAFSPFIPGNDKDSGLPVTIQSITIKNLSHNPVELDVMGWLENKMLVNTGNVHKDFVRINKVSENKTYKGIALQCITDNKDLAKAPDYGDMFFGIVGGKGVCIDNVNVSTDKSAAILKGLVTASDNSPVAGIITTHQLKPGQEVKNDFIIAWYTPNLSFYSNGNSQGMTVQDSEYQYYTSHFENVEAVTAYLATNYQTLKHQTLLWKNTFYDSTLPWWFLERTFMNVTGLVHYACWSHAIDLIHYFAGPIAEISALQGQTEHGMSFLRARDVTAAFRTMDDATGTLIGTTTLAWDYPLFELSFNFERGRIRMQDLDGDMEVMDARAIEIERYHISAAKSRWDQYNSSFVKSVKAYLESIRQNEPPPVPGIAGLQELQFEAGLKRSVALNRPVALSSEFQLA